MAKQPKASASSKPAASPQHKFLTARKAMAASMIEREDEIDLVLTALLCSEHPLLIGPPGTGKSMLLDALMSWMDTGKKFNILFSKFSTPEEVFGPISVNGLKNDVYRRITTAKLPEAHVAFLDEVFKASPAILNTMLKVLNERTYENGDGTSRVCPLQICIAASNEGPADAKELGALFDRFLFRKKVRPVSSKLGRSRLLWDASCTPEFTETISPEEVEQACSEATAIPYTDAAKTAFEKIVSELNAEGIFPGDRRMRKSVKGVRAFAYLRGASKVEEHHLEILAHTLWDDMDQADKAAKIVARIANPIGMEINSLLMQAEEIAEKRKPHDAVPELQKVQKTLQAMQDHPRKSLAIAHVSETIKSLYNQVLGVAVDNS